jgi:hypothetical protein
MSIVANLQGFVSRILPGANADNQNSTVNERLWRYGETPTVGLLRKQSALAEEGSYRLALNGQTAILAPAAAAFVATTPALVIFNANAVGGANICLDYLSLGRTTAVGTWASAGINEQIAVVIDNGNRYTSGGTALTVVSPNMALSSATGATITAGAITATAATAAARTVVGARVMRQAASATVCGVIGEEFRLNFGGVESGSNGTVTIALATFQGLSLPPVIVAPQTSALIYYIMNGTTPSAPSSFLTELGYYER